MDHKDHPTLLQHPLKSVINKHLMQWQNVLRNEFKFWNVHGIMNTSGLLQSK